MPGPQQCHPRVGENRPEWGCIPVEILKKVAAQMGIANDTSPAQMRSEIEKEVGVDGVHIAVVRFDRCARPPPLASAAFAAVRGVRARRR